MLIQNISQALTESRWKRTHPRTNKVASAKPVSAFCLHLNPSLNTVTHQWHQWVPITRPTFKRSGHGHRGAQFHCQWEIISDLWNAYARQGTKHKTPPPYGWVQMNWIFQGSVQCQGKENEGMSSVIEEVTSPLGTEILCHFCGALQIEICRTKKRNKMKMMFEIMWHTHKPLFIAFQLQPHLTCTYTISKQ